VCVMFTRGLRCCIYAHCMHTAVTMFGPSCYGFLLRLPTVYKSVAATSSPTTPLLSSSKNEFLCARASYFHAGCRRRAIRDRHRPVCIFHGGCGVISAGNELNIMKNIYIINTIVCIIKIKNKTRSSCPDS
jgi:hypothetical protein